MYLRGGEGRARVFAKVLGELDFFRVGGGEGTLEGEALPERSSDVTARLALWELSERSLRQKSLVRTQCSGSKGSEWRKTSPALLLLLLVLLRVSAPVFALLLLLLRLLFVLVFALVLLPDHRQVQRHRGRRARGPGPFLFTVASFGRPTDDNTDRETFQTYTFIHSIIKIMSLYLALSKSGEDTAAFFSFFPEPGPLAPLCLGEPRDFLGEGESLELMGSGEACRGTGHI